MPDIILPKVYADKFLTPVGHYVATHTLQDYEAGNGQLAKVRMVHITDHKGDVHDISYIQIKLQKKLEDLGLVYQLTEHDRIYLQSGETNVFDEDAVCYLLHTQKDQELDNHRGIEWILHGKIFEDAFSESMFIDGAAIDPDVFSTFDDNGLLVSTPYITPVDIEGF